MKKRTIRIIIILLSFVLSLPQLTPAVPQLINYQGKLSSKTGSPVSGTVSMVFSMYTVSTGGVSIWTEAQSVSVSSGIYNVLLGSVTPLPAATFDNSSLYLGVKAGSDAEMFPRQQLSSVPFAIKAATVESVPASAITNTQIAVGAQIDYSKLDHPDSDHTTLATKTELNTVSNSSWNMTSSGLNYNGGNVVVGTMKSNFTTHKLIVSGMSLTVNSFPKNPVLMGLYSEDSRAADMGAGISFGGISTGTWATNFAYIGGLKENSIDGNTSGKLVFGTRINGNDGIAEMTKMTILSNGNVGIGVTSPVHKLEVSDGVDRKLIFSGWDPESIGGATISVNNDANSAHVPLQFAASKYYFHANNVGIGTPNPATMLHLYKPAGLGQTNTIKIETEGSASDNLGFASIQLDGGISNLDNAFGEVTFMNKGVIKGRLAAKSLNDSDSGHMYIQVADINGNFPYSYQLSIDGSNNGNVGIGTDAPTSKLYVVGNIYATGTITQGSSRELKQNVDPLNAEDAILAFKQLQPVTYKYKDNPEENQVGFIAEDVPSLLATNDRKGLTAMDFIAVLTKVVQEQQKTVETLKQEVADLKAKQ